MCAYSVDNHWRYEVPSLAFMDLWIRFRKLVQFRGNHDRSAANPSDFQVQIQPDRGSYRLVSSFVCDRLH
jgi:hypothetical protein